MPVTTQEEADAALLEIKQHLQHGGYVRLEFSFAFGVNGTVQTIQLYRRPENPRATKWEKVGPFLTCEENTRSALLEMLANIAKEED